MKRITKKHVAGIFEEYLKITGRRHAQSISDAGGYRLDYNSAYGGYNVEKVSNENGGVSCPFGSCRMRPQEMWNAINFALRAHEDVAKHEISTTVIKALESSAASFHHPSCSWGKTGSGNTCKCHVGACNDAIAKVKAT